MPDTPQHYTYDVFISYHPADRAWVEHALLPRLERAGMRVCIDFRSFKPDLATSKNSEDALLHSRKTLLVFTTHYIASTWEELKTLLPKSSLRRVHTPACFPCS